MPLEDECETVVIIGHGCMNRTIINRFMDIPLADFWEVKLDNCAVTTIDVTDGRSTVKECSLKYYSRDCDRFRLPAGIASIYG